MLHEYLKAYIVGENGGATTFIVMVCLWRIQVRQQEPSLRSMLVANYEPGDGESMFHDHLGVVLRRLQESSKVHMLLLILISLLLPRRDRFTVENDNVEETIKQ